MITFEEFEQKIKKDDPNLNNAYFINITRGLTAAARELRGKNNTALADVVEKYANATEHLQDFPVKDEDIEAGYEGLKGFAEFLSLGEPSNYSKIVEAVPDETRKAFELSMMRVSDGLELELDLNALKSPSQEHSVEDNSASESSEYQSDTEVSFNVAEAFAEETIPAYKPLQNDDLVSLPGTMSAAAYIENIKDHGFPVKNPSALEPQDKDLYIDRFIRIMAARELADSDRGHAAKLNRKTLSAEEVDARATQMKKDPTFRAFIKTLESDEKKLKSAISAAASGHGGGLDDMFKDYIKKQPACKLRNDSILKRYMPNAKERLEILQDQYKTYKSSMKELRTVDNKLKALRGVNDPAAINKLQAKKVKLERNLLDYDPGIVAAEMITLRSLIKADKGKKASLDKTIPVSEGAENLSRSSNLLVDNDDVRRILTSRTVTDLINTGHGGNMMAEARTLANNALDKKDLKAEFRILNANTIETRLKAIENEAGELSDKLYLARTNNQLTGDLMKDAKKLLGEYMMLDGKVRSNDPGKAEKDLLLTDTPWGEIETMKKKDPESNPSFRDLVQDLASDDMEDLLSDLAKGKREQFISRLAGKKNEMDDIEEDRQSVSSYDSLDMEAEDPNVSMLSMK